MKRARARDRHHQQPQKKQKKRKSTWLFTSSLHVPQVTHKTTPKHIQGTPILSFILIVIHWRLFVNFIC